MSEVTVKMTRAEAEYLFHTLMDMALEEEQVAVHRSGTATAERQAKFLRQLASKVAPWLAPN